MPVGVYEFGEATSRTRTYATSPEGTVFPDGEQLTTVMLEAGSPVERRARVGADSPVPPKLPSQRDPEPTTTALRLVPVIPISGLVSGPVLRLQPALVTRIVVFTVVTCPRFARHDAISPHVAGSWYDRTYASAAMTVSQTSTARPSVSYAVRIR